MAITNRTSLTPGTKLTARYKGEAYTATVTELQNIRLEDGRTFKSLSAAGAAIMGEGRTCNGWAFWTAEGQKPAANEKQTYTVAEMQELINKVMFAQPEPRRWATVAI